MVLTVVGIGSRGARDDEVGLLLVETLAKRSSECNVVTRLWENADSLTLAHDLLELSGPVLIVDCADMGLAAGSWRFFSSQESQIKHHSATVSTHGLGMAEALTIAQGLGYKHTVHLFGIQPFDLSPALGLTTEMKKRFPAILEALDNAIHELNCLRTLAQDSPKVQPQAEFSSTIRLSKPLDRIILAMGMETKNSIALGKGSEVVISPSLGDMATPEARSVLEEAVATFMKYPGRQPTMVAVDLHPDLFPTVFGRRLAEEQGIPVVAIQHHHAHAAACMAEHGLEESLALSFDGMGWGTDGTIWGAELLHVHHSGFDRLGSFAPVPLPGGDAAVRYPVRQLVARLNQAGVKMTDDYCQRLNISETEARVWVQQCNKKINAPISHAAGRLFDAFAALLGIAPVSIAHEGEPAMRLEAEAKKWSGSNPDFHIPFHIREQEEMLLVDWTEVFQMFATNPVSPDETAPRAFAFHDTVAQAMTNMIAYGAEKSGLQTVVLSGGVFFNRLLLERLLPRLQQMKITVFQHQRVATGDGGIALGQVWIGGRMV